MAQYSVIIQSESDLSEVWDDTRVPHMNFGFNEIELSECRANANGTYTATYNSMYLAQSASYTYIHKTNGETTYTLPPGEYGFRPMSKKS